jgi:nucleoside-diphosphate-sugar epimerase
VMTSSALVIGATGIVGNNLARHLRQRGWQVHGLARRPPLDIEGVLPIAADLLDSGPLRLVCETCVLRMSLSPHGYVRRPR